MIDAALLQRVFDLGDIDPEYRPAPPHIEPPDLLCMLGDPIESPFSVSAFGLSLLPDAPDVIGEDYNPGDSSTTPFGQTGLVSHRRASIVVECSAGPQRGRHYVSTSLRENRNETEIYRWLLVDVVVDVANRARERYGCGDLPITAPDTLTPPAQQEPITAGTPVCGLLPSADVPRLGPDGAGWQQSVTPEPSPLLSNCQLINEAGAGATFSITRDVIAEALRLDQRPQFADPPYDHVCNGEPVSYRVYGPDQVWNDELLPVLAGAAAERAGCPLS